MRRRLAVVDNDGDGVTGDNDDDYFDDATDFAVIAMALLPSSRWHRTMATARQATKSTTMAMARRDTTTTAMTTTMTTMTTTPARQRATSVTIAKGDNRNRNDGEVACASTATTSAHWRRRRHSPL
jgi:hypothetical protein